ncbi:hypothetical protein ABH907_003769 [Pseudomonas frederiksbergensis]|uniref:hypothetical protein n=1 Tax=Pseudomonas frederiksbergensis TaxID=104087 RepID=UPI003D2500BD
MRLTSLMYAFDERQSGLIFPWILGSMGLHMRNSKTSHFTNRGSHFGNEWRVFSHKAKEHLTLFSDIELCYWLLFLEFDRSVHSFSLHPPARMVLNPSPRKLHLTAELMLKNGELEWHLLCGSNQVESGATADASALALKNDVRLKIFTPEVMVPVKYKICSLLKAAACLSAGKHYTLPPTLMSNLHYYLGQKQQGSLGSLIDYFQDYDVSLVLYGVVRLFAEGILDVEIAPYFFSRCTRWTRI